MFLVCYLVCITIVQLQTEVPEHFDKDYPLGQPLIDKQQAFPAYIMVVGEGIVNKAA